MTEEKKDTSPWPQLAKLFAVVIFLWILTWILLSNFIDTPEERGLFGDQFGSINALFSGLAFAGIVLTIYLQKRELELQRKELELTRKELKGQKEQLEAQNKTLMLQHKTLKHQNFENTFFQLLNLHSQIVEVMIFEISKERISKGRDCFFHWYNHLTPRYGKMRQQHPALSELEYMNKVYLDFNSSFKGSLGHYFRTLYNIFKFVNNSNVVDKTLYTHLVRAQLSNYELTMIFYNCLSSLGNEKFKPLIEKYGVLKHFDKGHILNGKHLKAYAESAFE